jgi:methylglutamate dehydrogenase subunit B
MQRIACPWCGPRDEAEFKYRGDATLRRPEPDAGPDAFVAYVYERDNPLGWHVEWWHHVHGCRRVLKVVRHTLTHEIAAVGSPQDDLPVPPDGAR